MLKKLYGVYILYAGVLFYYQVATPETFIYIMLLAMCFIPTIALKQFYLLQCIKIKWCNPSFTN
jgi:NHS family xanthosine MFS transporter